MGSHLGCVQLPNINGWFAFGRAGVATTDTLEMDDLATFAAEDLEVNMNSWTFSTRNEAAEDEDGPMAGMTVGSNWTR